MDFTFKLRRDSSSVWTAINPVLSDGEPGVESDTGRLKIGDGATPWTGLDYFVPQSGESAEVTDLPAHIDSLTPHPVYDDGPSLVLLYVNAKV